MTELAGFKIGNYVIVESLGRGTSADSFLARDDKGKLAVAKRLLPDLASDVEVAGRFLGACQLSSKIRMKRHIAKNISQKKSPEGIFLLREYVPGKTLRELIDSGDAEYDKHRAALDICDAVRALSKQKLVHGGLHPSNVFIQKDGRIKIADYATSRLALTERMSDDYPAEALRYLSIQQINSGKSEFACDIYSAGLLIWGITEGEQPTGNDRASIVAAIKEGFRPKSPALVAAVDVNPNRRFSSIDELRGQLVAAEELKRDEEKLKAEKLEKQKQEELQREAEKKREESQNQATPSKPNDSKENDSNPEQKGGSQSSNSDLFPSGDGPNAANPVPEVDQPPTKEKIPPKPRTKFGKLTAVRDVVGKAELINTTPQPPLMVPASGVVQRPLQLTNGGKVPVEITVTCAGNGVQVSPDKLTILPGSVSAAVLIMQPDSGHAKLKFSWQEKEVASAVVQVLRVG